MTYWSPLARQFRRVHRNVPCAHQSREAEIIAECILDPATPPGPVVELGAYKGGMSCKLSLACREAGRRLFICDTFSGLPSAETHVTMTGKTKAYHPGYYAGSVMEVTQALRQYGALYRTLLIPGDFARTLPEIRANPAVVFMDVDLIASAKTCIEHLWPRMVSGGRWYIHEASVQTFIEAIVPLVPETVLWGAGYGMGPDAANLAYWIKT